MSSTSTTTHAWGTQPEMFGPRHEHRLGMILAEVRQLPRGTRLLDGAIGLGQLATRMHDRGMRVFGIDYSFDAALHVSKSSTIPVVVGDMTRMPFKDGVFGAMTTGETLEHLDDDVAAAREIGRVIADDGRVIATVPALQSLWSKSDDYYEHRRRYTRDALTSMFRDSGFSIRRANYWGFPIVLVYDTLFLLPMNKRRARMKITEDAALQSVAKAGKSRLLVNTMRRIFSLDRLFERIPFGPGLLMVAIRNQRSREAAAGATGLVP
jgi:SAM-dependent methyltransferase